MLVQANTAALRMGNLGLVKKTRRSDRAGGPQRASLGPQRRPSRSSACPDSRTEGHPILGLVRGLLESATREREGHPQDRARMLGRIEYSATGSKRQWSTDKSMMRPGRDPLGSEISSKSSYCVDELTRFGAQQYDAQVEGAWGLHRWIK